MIIGISGKKQSGKDTVGLILQYFTIPKNERTISIQEWLEIGSTIYKEEIIGDKYLPVKKFAAKLKDISSYLLNVPVSNFENEQFKESELPEIWKVFKVKYSDGLCTNTKLFNEFQDAYDFFIQCVNIGFLAEEPIEYTLSYRDFLIQFGTDGGRDQVHPNIWVYSTFSDYNPNSNWIISDVRFFNELKFIKKFSNRIIRVDRDAAPKVDTITETQLDNSYQDFDYVIYNNGSIDDLIDNVKLIIENDTELKPLFYV